MPLVPRKIDIVRIFATCATRTCIPVFLKAAACLALAALSLAGCAAMEPPGNHDGPLYDLEKAADLRAANLSFTANQCPPAGTTLYIMPANQRRSPLTPAIRYSPGDRVNILVPGSQEFTADYVIGADGLIRMPFIPGVRAAGLTDGELTTNLQRTLLKHRMFSGDDFRISVRPVLFSAVNITISGAVFLPGRVMIGGVRDSDKGERAMNKFGDNPADRDVAGALRGAGGVRPDADLNHVVLQRAGRQYVLDWRGALTGRPVDDIILIEGDHIEVGEANCFQSGLVRPSQITPPGIRIFQSNLTQPVNSNANSAIGQQSQNIPYGTRLLAGLVAANCVGGSLASNARRFGVLISRNPKTHKTEVIQRSIEELVRSPDRDSLNPYLMPDDSIACYDSGVIDAKEFANVLQSLFVPVQTAHTVKPW